METTEKSSTPTSKKRNLTVFDMMNGARLVGESVVGFDKLAVIRPALLGTEKGEEEGAVKISINPILFTQGTVYQLQPSAVMASYQCFDNHVHDIYERALAGEGANAGSGAEA